MISLDKPRRCISWTRICGRGRISKSGGVFKQKNAGPTRRGVWMPLLLWLCAAPALAFAQTQPPQLVFSADRPAALYWIVNAMAGDSHAESQAYRDWWRTAGPQQADDAAMLNRFAEVRSHYRGDYLHLPARENGFLPVPPLADTRLDLRFSTLFLGAGSVAAIAARAEVLLTTADAAKLQQVIDHFGPRLEALAVRAAQIGKFSEQFEIFAKEQHLATVLDQLAVFLGVPSGAMPAARVHFVPAPPGEVLHGRRLGQDVVVEVRDGDTPARRADVVVHEIAHLLYERAGLEDEPQIYRAFFAPSLATAAQGWDLLNEGLATAIGQGVMQELVNPKEFAESLVKPNSWYVNADIDTFAKALFPLVKTALAEKGTLLQIMPEIRQAWVKLQGDRPVLLKNWLQRFLLVGDRKYEAKLSAFLQELGPRAYWRVEPDEAGGMAKKYAGVSMLIAATQAELPSLLRQSEKLGLAKNGQKALKMQGKIWVQPRPTAGRLFLLIGRDGDDLALLLHKMWLQQDLPLGWTTL